MACCLSIGTILAVPFHVLLTDFDYLEPNVSVTASLFHFSNPKIHFHAFILKECFLWLNCRRHNWCLLGGSVILWVNSNEPGSIMTEEICAQSLPV